MNGVGKNTDDMVSNSSNSVSIATSMASMKKCLGLSSLNSPAAGETVTNKKPPTNEIKTETRKRSAIKLYNSGSSVNLNSSCSSTSSLTNESGLSPSKRIKLIRNSNISPNISKTSYLSPEKHIDGRDTVRISEANCLQKLDDVNKNNSLCNTESIPSRCKKSRPDDSNLSKNDSDCSALLKNAYSNLEFSDGEKSSSNDQSSISVQKNPLSHSHSLSQLLPTVTVRLTDFSPKKNETIKPIGIHSEYQFNPSPSSSSTLQKTMTNYSTINDITTHKDSYSNALSKVDSFSTFGSNSQSSETLKSEGGFDSSLRNSVDISSLCNGTTSSIHNYYSTNLPHSNGATLDHHQFLGLDDDDSEEEEHLDVDTYHINGTETIIPSAESVPHHPIVEPEEDDKKIRRRSSLKQKEDTGADCASTSTSKPSKKGIKFNNVSVYYFSRSQGFSCVPSQGGSTLGMDRVHFQKKDFTLDEHCREQRRMQKYTKMQLVEAERNSEMISQKFPLSSTDSLSADAINTDDESYDIDSAFLQPLAIRQRRSLLRECGISSIESEEKDECKDIRLSRELCGCQCKFYCFPETCQCIAAGIKCQVDRHNFPCGCSKQGCNNPQGRIEFNPIRVRTHFITTLMRLELERQKEGCSWQEKWTEHQGSPSLDSSLWEKFGHASTSADVVRQPCWSDGGNGVCQTPIRDPTSMLSGPSSEMAQFSQFNRGGWPQTSTLSPLPCLPQFTSFYPQVMDTSMYPYTLAAQHSRPFSNEPTFPASMVGTQQGGFLYDNLNESYAKQFSSFGGYSLPSLPASVPLATASETNVSNLSETVQLPASTENTVTEKSSESDLKEVVANENMQSTENRCYAEPQKNRVLSGDGNAGFLNNGSEGFGAEEFNGSIRADSNVEHEKSCVEKAKNVEQI